MTPMIVSDNGKPVARRGRKAMGLDSEIARPPNHIIARNKP